MFIYLPAKVEENPTTCVRYILFILHLRKIIFNSISSDILAWLCVVVSEPCID